MDVTKCRDRLAASRCPVPLHFRRCASGHLTRLRHELAELTDVESLLNVANDPIRLLNHQKASLTATVLSPKLADTDLLTTERQDGLTQSDALLGDVAL